MNKEKEKEKQKEKEKEKEKRKKAEKEERSDMAPPDKSPRPNSGLSLSVLGKYFILWFFFSQLT